VPNSWEWHATTPNGPVSEMLRAVSGRTWMS
jgi:hypothetical protein